MSDRQCRVDKCSVNIPSPNIACTKHWRFVPYALKEAFLKQLKHPGSVDFYDTRDACIEHVNTIERNYR